MAARLIVAVLAVPAGGAGGWWAGGALASGGPGLPALVAGALLLLAVLATAGHIRWRATVDDAALAERLAASPVLAHLVPPPDPSDLPTLDPGSRAAGDFRHVRIAVEQLRPAPAVVAVTGLDAGDHAVWVAANLAISLAGAGRRTLLADARTGAPAEGAPAGPGLRGVLAGASLGSAVSPGPVPGLEVLPPGRPVPTEPARVDDTLRRLGAAAEGFEVVVVLVPAWEDGDHARRLVGPADLVLVLPEGRVRRHRLRGVAAGARAAGTRLHGLVLLAPSQAVAR